MAKEDSGSKVSVSRRDDADVDGENLVSPDLCNHF